MSRLVTVPIGVAAGYDLRIVDLHLDVRLLRDRGIELVEQHVAEETAPRRHQTVEFELQALVIAGALHAFAPVDVACSVRGAAKKRRRPCGRLPVSPWASVGQTTRTATIASDCGLTMMISSPLTKYM